MSFRDLSHVRFLKRTVITLSKSEFEEIDGKLHYKVLSRKTYAPNMRPYEARAWELYEGANLSWREVASILNQEGFLTPQGLEITGDQLLKRWDYLKKNRGEK